MDSKEIIAEYLNAIWGEGNVAEIITDIGNIAKSAGMSKIAEDAGLCRPSIYKMLSQGAKPRFSTIMKVLNAVGGQIHINPIPA